jgi:hypothetical protein
VYRYLLGYVLVCWSVPGLAISTAEMTKPGIRMGGAVIKPPDGGTVKSRSQVVQERLGAHVQQISGNRQMLSSQKTCYDSNHPELMAWYKHTSEAPTPQSSCNAGDVVSVPGAVSALGDDPCWGGDYLDFAYVCSPAIAGSQTTPIILSISRDNNGVRVLDAQYTSSTPSFDTELTFSNCKARLVGSTACSSGVCSGSYQMWIAWQQVISADPDTGQLQYGWSAWSGPAMSTPTFSVNQLSSPSATGNSAEDDCFAPPPR